MHQLPNFRAPQVDEPFRANRAARTISSEWSHCNGDSFARRISVGLLLITGAVKKAFAQERPLEYLDDENILRQAEFVVAGQRIEMWQHHVPVDSAFLQLAEATVSRIEASLIGTTAPPPNWLVSVPRRRREYYVASRRFVQYLIDRGGMETFLALYDSTRPEFELLRLYGAERRTLLVDAGILRSQFGKLG